ncbi:dephospho-CoA kinase [Microlunatus parietis]|uniref:Dephospho-CoA kinase n=1 Tax=Microlunatus parietis TaxID=682979 RepID=A0A7Y9LFK8_9ACTN|nr:dephospho-CoA kinase [Microlunatus parietis]NYE74953.1 dephospho-CoA kinase [Microlunatus parietis]
MRIALTGGIASGKSAVSDLLCERGAVIIDSDLLAREVVAPGTPGLAAVVQRFGPQVLDGDQLDRAALGKIIFADPAARRDLEAITHPLVRQRAEELERAAPDDAVVIQVIPLLVEAGLADGFDLVIVVDADPAQQRERLRRRNGLDERQVEERLAAQASRAERLAVADLVIDNTGPAEALPGEVDRLWRRVQDIRDAK